MCEVILWGKSLVVNSICIFNPVALDFRGTLEYQISDIFLDKLTICDCVDALIDFLYGSTSSHTITTFRFGIFDLCVSKFQVNLVRRICSRCYSILVILMVL